MYFISPMLTWIYHCSKPSCASKLKSLAPPSWIVKPSPNLTSQGLPPCQYDGPAPRHVESRRWLPALGNIVGKLFLFGISVKDSRGSSIPKSAKSPVRSLVRTTDCYILASSSFCSSLLMACQTSFGKHLVRLGIWRKAAADFFAPTASATFSDRDDKRSVNWNSAGQSAALLPARNHRLCGQRNYGVM